MQTLVKILATYNEDNKYHFFADPEFVDRLTHRFQRVKRADRNIEDVYDGTLYKKEFTPGGFLSEPYNISVKLNTGGGQEGLNLPLPVPFNPGSRPVFFGSRPFAFFRLRNIAQRCVIFPFFSRFPPPWESRFPPPLLPPPVHLPPPFLPVSRPPVPPHNTDGVAIFHSSQFGVWPLFLLINELPPSVR